MKAPASVRAGEKYMPGLTSLWNSFGDLPRQYQAWLKNFKKNINWKILRFTSRWSNRETVGFSFLDKNDSTIVHLEEQELPKYGKFLLLYVQNNTAHLTRDMARKLAENLMRYANSESLE